MTVTQRKKETQTKKALKSGNWNGPSLMVIEDNSDHWMLIKQVIHQVMPEVEPVLAINEGQALDYLDSCGLTNTSLPRLILLDLYFPQRENGWRLLECIKQMSAPINRLPVVVLSGSADPNDINGSYRRGATSYIVKPVTIDDWMAYFQYLKTYWEETLPFPARTSYFRFNR